VFCRNSTGRIADKRIMITKGGSITPRISGALRTFLFFLWAGLFLICTASTQIGCNRKTSRSALPSLELRSTTFSQDSIPKKCTCDGQDTSPELSWISAPQQTQSFVLIMTDKGSRLPPMLNSFAHWVLGYFVHWTVYDLPADKRELPEGIAKLDELPDGSRQGKNDFDKVGYGGPCPPAQSTHHYAFALYALDSKLNLPGSATEKQMRQAMNGHILAQGELIVPYHRSMGSADEVK